MIVGEGRTRSALKETNKKGIGLADVSFIGSTTNQICLVK